ncbi:MAG: tRNA epoxyqueuosine(34) reductase QueG [Candidatus Marinimicrobia bacterium]|nr:tRNA epoxyqueuosine(34) reductase QueG [Candidatus Neomarinimicrobiota bacterium]
MKLSLLKLQQLKKEINIDLIGVAKAEHLKKDENVYKDWLKKNYHADMNWMEKHLDKRSNPELLFPNTKSVIVIGMNYYNKISQKEIGDLLVSKYVTKIDYHKFVKNKLYLLLKKLKEIDSSIKGRAFVDTAPIFEKAWAIKAGIGWRGKNSLVISPEYGSWIFLGILLVNVEFDRYSKEKKNQCGDCNLCIDACPTNAILEGNKIDANRCISYWTVENNDEKLPENIELENWIYGCDICQNVCPFNKQNSKKTVHQEFELKKTLQNRSKKYWEKLSEKEYKKIKKNTAMERKRFLFILRDINHNLQYNK